jgi:hypothetical protein
VTAADRARVRFSATRSDRGTGLFHQHDRRHAALRDGFAKVKGTAPAIASYVNSHALPGVVAKNDLTLVSGLLRPAPDFPNILHAGLRSAGRRYEARA